MGVPLFGPRFGGALLFHCYDGDSIMLDVTENTTLQRAKAGAESKNVKFTISVSPKSAEALQELKEITDASTDSEVFRNALRIHIMLIRAHLDGKELYVKDTKNGQTAMIPVTLFAPE
jgi:hypothetical protein